MSVINIKHSVPKIGHESAHKFKEKTAIDFHAKLILVSFIKAVTATSITARRLNDSIGNLVHGNKQDVDVFNEKQSTL